MPMTICTKTLPMRAASPNMQSHLPLETELAQTFERLRHIHSHSQATQEPSVCPAHPHRQIPVTHLLSMGPDPTCLPFPGQQGESMPSSPYSSLTSSMSSSSSCCSSNSYSADSWSPRQKRRVVFADSVGLPLVEVRVFTCDPPADAPLPPCPGTLRRGQRSLAVRGKQPCQLHPSSSMHAAQPCADFPQAQVRQAQDKRSLQAHNDTLRRVNVNCPRMLPPTPHQLAKAHMHAPSHTLAIEHTHAAVHSHPPPEHTQAMVHTPPTAHAQRFLNTLPKAYTHSPSHTQATEHSHAAVHAHIPPEHAQRIAHTLPKAHTHAPSLQRQATERTHTVANTQPTAYIHTHPFAHTLPKAFGQVPGGSQGSPQQRPPSCGHSVAASRQQQQQPPMTPWAPRSRSPQPQPDCPPRVQNFAGQNWAWQEGMAVH